MTDLTVSQPTAMKLKAAGWNKRTDFYYIKVGDVWRLVYNPVRWKSEEDWLPAPTIGELQAELDSDTICRYILHHHSTHNKHHVTLMVLVADTMRSVQTLADVWLWKEGSK